ncbi:MAG: AbiJ-NTD4 domain-containing protein [Bacteroidota bacterium]
MSDFSSRHGFRGEPKEIAVREDAPEGLRFAISLIAGNVGMAPKRIRQVVCEALLTPPDPQNWGDEYVTREINELIAECPWFKVYDIVEGLYALFYRHNFESADDFQDRLNQYFLENGIDYQMEEGKIAYRGSEAFADATAGAVEALVEAGHTTAADEVHEALRDISRRPSRHYGRDAPCYGSP